MARYHSNNNNNYCYYHRLIVTCVAMATMHTTTPMTEAKIVDLSHDHSESTFMSTPDMPKYQTKLLFEGDFAPGVYIKFSEYSIAEHGGTHIDAPLHFYKDGYSLSEIPIENTMADGVMIDCTEEASKDTLYKVPLPKIHDWEATNGKIPPKAAVVFNFGWSDKFLNSTLYLNAAEPGNASTFQFPSVSEEVGDFLLDERDINIMAVDTISPDLMNTLYPVHVKLLVNNRMIVENVKDVNRLPVKGFRFHASPVKFVGGTGVQTRIYAIVPEGDCDPGTGSVFGCSVTVVAISLIMSLFL